MLYQKKTKTGYKTDTYVAWASSVNRDLNDSDARSSPPNLKRNATYTIKSYRYDIDFDAKCKNIHGIVRLYPVESQLKYLDHPRITTEY